MPNNVLKKLKEESKSERSGSDSQKLKEGETSWFAGRPVASSEGTLALAISKSVTLVFREDDILEAVKEVNRYLIRTSVDANVLFRQEVVLKADPARSHACSCASEEESGDDVAERRPLPPELRVPDIPDFFWDWNNPGYCFSDCRLEFTCVPQVTRDGVIYYVCFPVWNCVTRCSPGPRPQ